MMKSSSKIWLAISGILLVALGVMCICKPAATLFATAWMIGVFTLISGFSKLIFTFRTQAFLPNSGSRMLSALLQIIVGCIFLANNLFLAVSLPVIFVLWVLVESVVITIESFDYKKVGFSGWWCILLLGIAGIVLGIYGLRNPDVSAVTLSTFIGIAICLIGLGYLVALSGVNRFEKQVKQVLNL
ncbi:MAG: DUF308 domain-containing protein [Bacteroidales bacterium]|nr:DUF308 domain-containing protein [Bacteroidales bacterium]